MKKDSASSWALFSGWALSIGVVGEGARLGAFRGYGSSRGWRERWCRGVLAAVIPARRAARLDILQAIAYE